MGREVRMVPPDWQHPKKDDGRYRPLHVHDYEVARKEWDEGLTEWLQGRAECSDGGIRPDGYRPDVWGYIEWTGPCPTPDEYMPQWPDSERTHYMMYEDTSEGTPISPAFATPEELARWLVDNNANAFAGQTASYEGWLRVAKGGWAPSAVMTSGGIRTGVDMPA